MGVSRIHYCIGQEAVAQGEQEPPAKKCRCRKIISLADATALVKVGEAKWVVKERKRGEKSVICRLCHADPEVKNCAQCGGTGKQMIAFVEDIPGLDIVYTSSDPVDEAEKKKRKWLAPKTPRVATVESEHLELAYSDALIRTKINGRTTVAWATNDKTAEAARERIEEYGRLIIDARHFVGKDRVPTIKPEPADNPMTGEGRNCDYGRAI
jgi:hypothetical protein